MARRVAYHKNPSNKFSMFLAVTVVLTLLIVVTVGSISLKEKKALCAQRQQVLEERIAAEFERQKEIEEQEKYTHTMKYVEEMARKKLGLVYPDEIIFREN